MMNIFIDDLRQSPEGYQSFRTAEEFFQYLTTNTDSHINVLHLDHDLGLEVRDGYDVVKELYQNYSHIAINEVRLHTDNHVGFNNMYYYLVNAIKNEALPNIKQVSPYVWDVNGGNIQRGLKVH